MYAETQELEPVTAPGNCRAGTLYRAGSSAVKLRAPVQYNRSDHADLSSCQRCVLSLIIALPRERRTSERRVALDPSRVERLLQEGMQVRIEAECGHSASFHDEDYHGVVVKDSFAELVRDADIIVKVVCPTLEEIALLPAQSVLICIMSAFQHQEEIIALRDQQVTVLAMDQLPRITRAQPMDALSSQATVAGYKAALLAAELSPRLFPMLTTAAGTIRPSRVLVIGAGVAGLQAIATSRRLGAQVDAYDIRRAAKEQIESVGACAVDTGVIVEGAGGFARALRSDEKQKQHDVLAEHLARAHVVICAASIPGRRAPRIITEDMVDGMLPESVIVDMAASTGGNCELTKIGEHYYHHETLIVGPLNLPSHGAVHASEMYARNIYNMLQLVIVNAEVVLDPEDEIIARCVLMHNGNITDASTAKLLDVEPVAFGGAVHSAAAEMPDQTSGWLDDESDDGVSDEQRYTDNSAPQDTSAGAANVTADSQESALSVTGANLDDSAGDSLRDPSSHSTAPLASTNVATDNTTSDLANTAKRAATPSMSDEDHLRSDEHSSTVVPNDTAAENLSANLDELADDEAVQDLARLDGLTEPPELAAEVEPVLAVDDLTQIDGIGPALQGRLNAFGFRRLTQLAELDEQGIEKLAVQLELSEEIKQQDWVGQARQLVEIEQ